MIVLLETSSPFLGVLTWCFLDIRLLNLSVAAEILSTIA